jgi:hypothetical protein
MLSIPAGQPRSVVTTARGNSGSTRICLSFQRGFEDFVQGMFGDELLLYDKTFGTVVRIPNDKKRYRELRLRLEPGHANEQYIICEKCGTE